MSVPLSQENIWFNKAQCDDAERLYYEKLAGAKTQDEEDDVDLFSSDDEEPQAAPVKPAPKPAVAKPAPKAEPKPAAKVAEKIWTNKAECDDAEKNFQEAMAQPGSYRNPANAERTFIMLKPDAVHRGLVVSS
jgi:cell division protein FtsN